MRWIIILLAILILVGVVYSSTYWNRSVPIDFREFKAFNTTVRCVFYGLNGISCWEKINNTNN